MSIILAMEQVSMKHQLDAVLEAINNLAEAVDLLTEQGSWEEELTHMAKAQIETIRSNNGI